MAEDPKPGGQGSPNPPAPDDAAAKAAADKAAADKATADAATKAAADKAAADKGKTPEQIAAEAKTAADAKAAADAEAAKTKPPEKYELALPVGDWLTPDDLKTFEAQAREKGLTNEQAQAVLEERADQLAAQSQAFRTATEADPTYGGANLVETQRLANLALDKLRPKDTPAGKEIRNILARTGYGNHLAVVSLLADLGKQMAEDSPAGGGGGGGGGEKTAADILYAGTTVKP